MITKEQFNNLKQGDILIDEHKKSRRFLMIDDVTGLLVTYRDHSYAGWDIDYVLDNWSIKKEKKKIELKRYIIKDERGRYNITPPLSYKPLTIHEECIVAESEPEAWEVDE